MGITNLAWLGGWSFAALLGAAAAASCVDTAGSRNDLASGDDSGTSAGPDTGGGSSSGGSSSGAGSSSGSSGGAPDTGPATPDSCGFPPPTTPSGVLFSGFPMGTGMGCASNIPAPRNGQWFQYHDTSDDAGLSMSAKPEMGGCGGMSLCAFHVKGPASGAGFTGYGAGVGFDLNDNAAGTATNYDAMAAGYKGIQFWAKGTITGTRGPGYSSSAQTIHLKLVTATDRKGDDYGTYCQMIDPTMWTLCSLDFSKATRDGFSTTPDPTMDTLDYDKLLKVQFEFSRYSDPAALVVVDAWIDEVSFY